MVNDDRSQAQAFQDALRSIGPVQPRVAPFFTRGQDRSSQQPQSIKLLDARKASAEKADRETHGEEGPGREFLDAATLRYILILRDQEKMSVEDIERKLDLKKGVIKRMGMKGLVAVAG